MSDRNKSPFELDIRFPDPLRRGLFRIMRRTVERLFFLDQLNRLYEIAMERSRTEDFLTASMRVMDVTAEVSDEDLARVPRDGPLMIVANHPFGGLEGLVLLHTLREVRPDLKILANYLLQRIPQIHPYCVFVNPFGGDRASRANVTGIKASIRWLQEGHALLVFPSGEVSHLNLRRREVWDRRWNPTVARIIRHSGAAALPIFIEGRNSALFQMLGFIHPKLRTALLPREMWNKQGTRLRFRIGSVVPFERLNEFKGDDEMMDYLQLRTYILKGRLQTDAPEPPRVWGRRSRVRLSPIAPPLYPELIAQDVYLLPPEALLTETDDFAVYLARAEQIPRLLHEIGRLREMTFRAAGEGTGREIDLDRFDRYYWHLFLWNKKRNELVGAYRIGKTDEILPRYGKKGLYTSTLFRYSRKLLDAMGPALELGRSFIRSEYQKNYSSLLLLWKGIGRLIVREPRYRHLFGPVSINNQYNTLSRQMMEIFLRANNFRTDWARYVRPRNRPRHPNPSRWNAEIFRRVIKDPEEMSALIAEIEKDRKGVPVLLKQYLKLGGKLLGFNVDPKFSDVLDGLIWVDLLETDPRIMIRFIGREDAAAFLRYHHRSLEEELARYAAREAAATT